MSSSFRLKSSLLFFLDLRFLKGHLDWHIGCLEPTLSLSHPSSALWRRKKNKRTQNDDMESYYLLREWMSSHDCLSCHRARAFVVWFFFECAMTRLPESRVRDAKLNIKCFARLSPSQSRERRCKTLTFSRQFSFARTCTSSMCTFYTCVWYVCVVRRVNTLIRNRVTAV